MREKPTQEKIATISGLPEKISSKQYGCCSIESYNDLHDLDTALLRKKEERVKELEIALNSISGLPELPLAYNMTIQELYDLATAIIAKKEAELKQCQELYTKLQKDFADDEQETIELKKQVKSLEEELHREIGEGNKCMDAGIEEIIKLKARIAHLEEEVRMLESIIKEKL